jgi:hypothetical protein
MFWTQRQDIGPPARAQVASAYEEGRQRFVVFGGVTETGTPLGDTWEWNGELWTQVADTGPPPSYLGAMAYDAERNCIVLFGGRDSSMDSLRDTWEWNGELWTQVADTGPPARTSHAMAFDASRKEIVLYGGYSPPPTGGAFSDTWAWNGADWTQKEDVGPGARYGHSMAFDDQRSRVTMFGGETEVEVLVQPGDTGIDTGLIGKPSYVFEEMPQGDTWEWDGWKWASAADTGPAPRWGHVMAYDGKSVLLYGGTKGNTYPDDLFGDTWAWDGKYWTQLQDIGPSARSFPAMGHDSARGRVVLFGGYSGAQAVVRDTWEWFDHSGVA